MDLIFFVMNLPPMSRLDTYLETFKFTRKCLGIGMVNELFKGLRAFFTEF